MRRLIAATAALACLGGAATAQAAPHHLTGGFRADDDAAISMTVVTRHGVPVAARDIEFTDLDYSCDGSGATGELSGSVGPTSVFRSARGGYELESESTGPATQTIIVGGLLPRSGRRVAGGVVFYFDGGTDGICQSLFDGRYVAR